MASEAKQEPAASGAGSNSGAAYPLTAEQLYGLVYPKDPSQLEEYGGAAGLAKAVKSHLKKGLSTAPLRGADATGARAAAEAASSTPLESAPGNLVELSRAVYGPNKLPPADVKTMAQIVRAALEDRTLIMLIVAATISLVVGVWTEGWAHGWVDGTAVLIAVVLVVAITAINDYQKEQQFRALNDKKNDRDVVVIRNGEKATLSIFDVVVGDLIVFATGDVLPADGVFVSGVGVQCDESASTGESKQIKKGKSGSGADPFFLSGTRVVEGNGTMLAIAVGPLSYNGQILLALRTPPQDTPLQQKLSVLADRIGYFGLIAAGFIFSAQAIKYLAIKGSSADGLDAAETIRQMVDFLIIAISIVVVAVPEGLPLAVTIGLAYSMKNMMKDQNLVRTLDASETMGGATTICSDKTGTLTLNEMTVVDGFLLGTAFTEEDPFEGRLRGIGSEPLRLLQENIAVNSTAFEGVNERTGQQVYIGNQTECALLRFSQRVDKALGVSERETDTPGGSKGASRYIALREAKPPVHQFPFSSLRKRMGTVVAHTPGGAGAAGAGASASAGAGAEGPAEVVLHAKGASEVVLAMCSHYLGADGKVHAMADPAPSGIGAAEGEDMRAFIGRRIDAMAGDALRTLCLAMRVSPTAEAHDWTDDEEPGLVCVGVVGIRDPVRPDVPLAVKRCQAAGVTVRMVTGDNKTTAINIARKCGILPPGGPDAPVDTEACMEGPVFRKLDNAQKDAAVVSLRVLARSSPLDKLELVKALQRRGEVVAVTGDGVNDGPALKQADVGFSMGLSGTEVAKEASAIVLLDDNFASIVNAIRWGRNVFQSIRKFLQFQLTVNFTAILLMFIVVLADADGGSENAPLQPVQLLWVNLIMDSFAAIGLATEPPDGTLLDMQPFGRTEPLVNPLMWRKMITQVVLQTITFCCIMYAGEPWFSTSHADVGPDAPVVHGTYTRAHHTVIFAVFVLSQLFNQFNSRKVTPAVNVFSNILRHRIFIGVWLFAFVVQLLITQFGGDFVFTTGLTAEQWLLVFIFSMLPLLWGLILDLLPESYQTSPLWWQKPGAEGGSAAAAGDATAVHVPERRVSAEGTSIRLTESQRLRAQDRWAFAIRSIITQQNVVRRWRRHRR